MMPKILYLNCLILVALFSCNNGEFRQNNPNSNPDEQVKTSETSHSLASIYWLEGKWIGEVEGIYMTEEWTKTDDNKLSGRSYFVDKGDTNFFEKLRLEIIDNQITYVADVAENEKAVYFKLIKEKPNQVIFENKEHDFPNRLTYTFQQPNHLHVKLSGKENGERKEMEIFFEKELD